MNRRVICLVLSALFATQGLVVSADAAIPEGPRLAITVFGDGPGAEDEFSEVITTGPAGEDPQALLGGPGSAVWGGISWSADGDRISFSSGSVEGTSEGAFGTGWPVLGVMTVGGGDPRLYPRGFLNGGDPVISPDGRTVVFSRLKLVKTLPGRENNLFGVAIWALNVERGSVRRLTRWRLGAFADPIAFSPDGGSIVAELRDRRGRRIVAIDAERGRSRPVARLPLDAREPTFSPDGTRLAYVRDRTRRFDLPRPDRPISELWVAGADGRGARRLLRARGYVSSPSWDPSASRLAFGRDPAAEATGALEPESGNRVMAINADGTCLTRVFTDPELNLGSLAWRPGPGRAAGPISC